MKVLSCLTLLACLSTAAVTHASDPENYIKYRQAVMKAIGGHMGASSQIIRGKVSPPGALAVHADALAALNADLAALFPAGSDFGETQAKENIWEDFSGFQNAADQAQEATAAFAAAVAGGNNDEIQAAQRAVGKTCKGCHEDYRRKDD
jgi:cytochrome c556